MSRWRGLVMLVSDAVEHGSRSVERLQKDVVRRPLELLTFIPAIEAPVVAIRHVHDLVVTTTHAGVRLANKALGAAMDRLWPL